MIPVTYYKLNEETMQWEVIEYETEYGSNTPVDFDIPPKFEFLYYIDENNRVQQVTADTSVDMPIQKAFSAQFKKEISDRMMDSIRKMDFM